MFFYLQTIIPIYNINLINNRKYFFKSKEYGAVLYTEIINNNMNSIITKNKLIISLEILYNYWFGVIVEYSFDNIFLIITELKNKKNITDLVIRKP